MACKYKYNYKMNVPQYTPKDTPPELRECIDIKKFRELKNKIKNSNVSDIEKKFLIYAASRHIVFNYSKIADYYASASPEMQKLMEESALVIIDFNDAIANGYVKLNKRMANIVGERLENNDA